MATGKPAQIMDALFARAMLMETQGPTLPVSVPEPASDFVPPADGKYLTVQFFPNGNAWEGVSDGAVAQGLLLVSVVWPKNEGLIRPTRVAGQVADHFAKGSELFSGATKVTIYRAPYVGPDLPDPDCVTIPVTIPWRA